VFLRVCVSRCVCVYVCVCAGGPQARKLREVLKKEHLRDLERSVDLMELAQVG
jgi:hypothetical protein